MSEVECEWHQAANEDIRGNSQPMVALLLSRSPRPTDCPNITKIAGKPATSCTPCAKAIAHVRSMVLKEPGFYTVVFREELNKWSELAKFPCKHTP